MRRTLVHPLTLKQIRPVGFRKDGRPIWPILGGSEPPNQPPAPPAGPPPANPPAPPAPPANPPADPPGDKGFPEGTPLEQMNVEQQRNYWRHYARQHESRANARADYDDVKAKAAKYDELQRQQQTPSEQAVNDAKDEGKREGAREAYAKSAAALLDTAKVETFVNSIAAPVKGGGPRPDPSQGPRGESGTASVSAGRDLFAERHKPRQTAGTTA
jgi:hypothetical protein